MQTHFLEIQALNKILEFQGWKKDYEVNIKSF